jgi:adenosylcobinamide-phosphate synthase
MPARPPGSRLLRPRPFRPCPFRPRLLGSGLSCPRALGLLLGAGLDAVFADPRRGHPVAGFGALAARLERHTWADSRRSGVGHVIVCVGAPVLAAAAMQRRARRPGGQVLLTAVTTWAVLGGRSLANEGRTMHRLLAQDDLPAARQRLSHLAGRDAAGLDRDDLARAVAESLAENTSDAVVAPLLWGAVGGVPGLVGYRAANTLDAMIGYRDERYLRFGWAAARLDDLANLVPARVTALLTAVVSGRPRPALRAWRRDAGQHPSPNAGPVEAAFAGGLGVRLGGRNVYGGQVEDRGALGEGPSVRAADLPRVVRLAVRVDVAAVAVAALTAWLLGRAGGRPARRRADR